MHEAYAEEIAPVVADRWAQTVAEGSNVQTKKDPNGAFRAQIAREVFAQLLESKRAGYAARAKEEAQERWEQYHKALKDPPSKSPESRQRYV